MGVRNLSDPCWPYSRFHSSRQYRPTHVIPLFNASAGVDGTPYRGEYVLPGRLEIGIRVLSFQGI